MSLQIFGLAVLVLGILFKLGWDEVRKAFKDGESDNLQQAGDTVAMGAIIFGAFILVISLVGCIGACGRVKCLLVLVSRSRDLDFCLGFSLKFLFFNFLFFGFVLFCFVCLFCFFFSFFGGVGGIFVFLKIIFLLCVRVCVCVGGGGCTDCSAEHLLFFVILGIARPR